MKISELASLSTLATTDLFNCVDVSDTSMAATGTNKKLTPATLATFLAANGLVDTEAAVDAVAAAFAAGSHTNITVSYNDAANSISLTASGGGGGITTEDAVDAVGAALVAGANMTVTYNDPAGTITLAASGGTGGGITVEDAVDAIAASLVAGNNIDITYNDAANTITVDVETLTTADITGLDAALTAKADAATTTSALAGKQPLDTDLTTIAGLTATTDNVIQSTGSAWASRTPAQLKSSLALTKTDVGLANVDNTSNATERAATATLTNKTIALGSNTVSGTLAQFNTAITDANVVENVQGVTGIWSGSQAAYDAIGTKVSTVLYVIV